MSAGAPFADDRPLLILGSVRSGTTLTRDLLRRVPHFICPEETHFFRWAEPFRSTHSWQPFQKNAVLRGHRALDGVDDAAYDEILFASHSRADLMRRYITAYATRLGLAAPYRWFEKSPQNVYGAALAAQEFPQARFLHMVRNPLNVVASLQLGRQMNVPDLLGACNYWCEAVQIMQTMTDAYPDRVMTLRYEDLIADVPGAMTRILAHAGVDQPPGLFHRGDAHAERNLWRQALSSEALDVVRSRCGGLARRHGYDLFAI